MAFCATTCKQVCTTPSCALLITQRMGQTDLLQSIYVIIVIPAVFTPLLLPECECIV